MKKVALQNLFNVFSPYEEQHADNIKITGEEPVFFAGYKERNHLKKYNQATSATYWILALALEQRYRFGPDISVSHD